MIKSAQSGMRARVEACLVSRSPGNPAARCAEGENSRANQ